MKNKIYNKIGVAIISLIAAILLTGYYFFPIHLDTVEIVKTKIKDYRTKIPYEKIYLHNDKPIYKPEETIWFSVYLVDGESNKASDVSDVVYIDLINPKGSIEKNLKLQAINGYCHGNFDISENTPGGIYKIKAYTKWMKNRDENNYFEKEVIVQKIVKPRILSKIDFLKESYSPGDKVKTEVSFLSVDNEPLVNINLDYSIFIDGENKINKRIQTDVNGEAIISFRLPDNLSSNDALLIVKTKYEGITESISRSVPIVLNNIKVQFFPEGGYLVENVQGRVAYKAINEFGKPADIKGKIFDSKNHEVCSFETFHQGMGTFEIKPLENETYYCKITSPDIPDKKIELPFVAKNGYSLSVTNNYEKETLHVKIHSPHNQDLTLLVVAYDKVIFSKNIYATQGENSLNINTYKFPIGIAKITLFDNEQIPRCERLVFLNPKKQLNINVKTDKTQYAQREKIKLQLSSTDSKGIPIPARISLAVVNEKLLSYADDKQYNILSSLLLGSELKGEIEEPSFYFDPEKNKAFEALDYLMLTHGWRRFEWNDIFMPTQKLEGSIAVPEKVGTISGRIVLKNSDTPVEAAEVYLLEKNNDKRVEKVITDSNGRFIFLNADASSELQLWVKDKDHASKLIQIEIETGGQTNSIVKKNLVFENSLEKQAIPELIVAEVIEENDIDNVFGQIKTKSEEKKLAREKNYEIMQSFSMTEDIAALDEVVVVGYGTQKKMDLTAAITSVSTENIFEFDNIATVLQGRVSGVEVVNSTARPGAPINVKVRGVNSVISGNPLYVIDGVPIEEDINLTSSPLDILSIDDIESISVIKDASATAIYGYRGNNGVIVIETKSNRNGVKRIPVNTKQRYAGLTIKTNGFSTVNKFYFPDYSAHQNPEERSDFRSTIYWNPNIVTDTKGEAEVFFYNSDEITTFRVVAEGISANGEIGRKEIKYPVKSPFSIDFVCPAYFNFYDVVELPVTLKNSTNQQTSGMLSIEHSEHLALMDESSDSVFIKLEEHSSTFHYFKFKVLNKKGKGNIKVKFSGNNFKDAVNKEIEVQPKGFPTRISFSGNKLKDAYSFNITEAVDGSLEAKIELYPNILSDLMNGIESMLREPYGCFEQTSSTTYPNIFILNYLKESGKVNPEIEKHAIDLISKGYNRLKGFETSHDGFEWFGHLPDHEGLTAYGLMEFVDMKKVYNEVSDELIKRTEKWLLSRRDGKGGFKRSDKGYDSFASAPQNVTNAYIVYAFSESKTQADYEPEYQSAYQEAVNSKDLYRLALMANASANLSRQNDYLKSMAILKNHIKENGHEKISAEHSITRSYGFSLNIEILSLYALAMMKEPEMNSWKDISDVCNYIVGSRKYGSFGSTQGTILALKALTNYAKLSSKVPEDGSIKLFINKKELDDYYFKVNSQNLVEFKNLENYLKMGENSVAIKFSSSESILPYSFNCNYTSLIPSSSDQCKVALQASIDNETVKVGNTVRLNVRLRNLEEDGLPMSIAVVGIPAGLSMQTWQLKEIQEKRLVDFYEIQKNYLILYYKEMGPLETEEINLDLKADCPGDYLGGASNAYLYYGAEDRFWTEGIKVKIVK